MDCVITRVSQTKKGRFALFCGPQEEFLFSVDAETFFAEGLKEGQTLTGGQLEQLRQKSDLRRAKDKALRYLAARQHASGELYQKLCRDFDEHTAAAAMARMDELGMLDDAGYAARLAAFLKSKNKSRRQAAQALRQRGLDPELIERALEEQWADEAADAAAALRLVQKHYARALAAGKRQNVLAALARRGFSARDARAAVEEFLAQAAAEYPPDDGPEGWA